MDYRFATLADVTEIAALVNSAYRGESSRVGWTTEADWLGGQRTDTEEVCRLVEQDGSLILLAFEGDKITGTAHLQKMENVAHVGMLVVSPLLQRQGHGKALIQRVEKYVEAEWQISRIQMQVITVRHELIAFYLRRGYVRTGIYSPFPEDVRYGVQKIQGLQLEILEKIL